MNTRHDIRLTIGVFIAFNLMISFSSISLLERMTPAVRQVIQENVYSLEAVEEMLTILASQNGQPVPMERREAFLKALERARVNITEESEVSLVGAIELNAELAFSGASDARRESLIGLRQLAEVNREAIRRADQEEIRLGTAGSWIVVLLGTLGFLLSLLMLNRLNRHVVRPVQEIYSALREWKEGNPRRRCNTTGAPLELENAMSVINQLMDNCSSPDAHKTRTSVDMDRAVLIHLLEREKAPSLVINQQGEIIIANNKALGRLSRTESLPVREELAKAAQGLPGVLVKEASSLRNSNYWLITLNS